MVIEGTFVDGKIIPDEQLDWPNGAKVQLMLRDEVGSPFEAYDHDREIEGIREAMSEIDQGLGFTLDEVIAEAERTIERVKLERK